MRGFFPVPAAGLLAAILAQNVDAHAIVDQVHYVAPDVSRDSIVANRASLAQTFTVGFPGVLAQVDLQVFASPGAVGDVILEIRTTSGFPPLPNTDSTQSLVALTVPTSTLTTYSSGTPVAVPFVAFDVSGANIVVHDGDVLAITLRGTGDVNAPVYWRRHQANVYWGGNYCYGSGDGDAWYEQGADLGFRTWVIPDCNANGMDDACDVECAQPGCDLPGCGFAPDCNGNLLPDACDLDRLTSLDCNADATPDECQLADNDCNSDLIPDDCQLVGNDCNANSLPDECDAADLLATANQPQAQHPCPGGVAQFDASTPTATGYQWLRNGVPLVEGGSVSGVNAPVLTVDPATAGEEGAYTCVVGAGCISGATTPAQLELTSDDVQVTLISVSPVETCASGGASVAAFEVSVDDATGVSYQWDRNGIPLTDGGNISGALTPRLEINPATGPDAGVYTVSVTNACMAQPATASGELRIGAGVAEQPPAIVCAEYGSNAVFTVVPSLPAPDYVLWYEGSTLLTDGGRISGAWTPTLTLSNVQAGDHLRQFSARLIVNNPPCVNNSRKVTLQAKPAGQCPACVTPGDLDGDGDHDLRDAGLFAQCFGGDAATAACACANLAGDTPITLADWATLVSLFDGPGGSVRGD